MRFLVAEVLSVSMVAVEGCAVVMGVSRWPASAAAEVSLVSTSPCRCVLCAKKFALRDPMVGVGAKKFAPRTRNTPKLVFLGLLGEFLRGDAAGGPVLGELFRGDAAGGAAMGEFFRAYRHCGQVIQVTWRLHAGNVGGFALHDALWVRVVGVSEPRVVQNPPFGG